MKKIILTVLVFIFAANLKAQMLDKIIAVVEGQIVLQSDLENQYLYMLGNGQKDNGTLKCDIFESLLTSKMLLSKAMLDSLTISNDDLDREIERRLKLMIQQFGSEEALESVYGKSLIEIKVDVRPDVKDEMLIDQQRNAITAGIKVTPKEVKDFYNSFPKDSLPLIPAEIELAHIVIDPPTSDKNKKLAKEKLEKIRQEIVSNKITFEEAAKEYSMGPSAKNGGSLGKFGRGDMVPEFEKIAFTEEVGKVSEIFESPFGFHILVVHKKLGQQVEASHILIVPDKDETDYQKSIDKLNEVTQLIKNDSLSFEEAAIKFSTDNNTKNNGGFLVNPQTGERIFQINALDPDLFFKVDEMKEGEISKPLEYIKPDGKKSYHILFLKKKIAPHTANFEEDYQKFYNATVQKKRSERIQEWFIKTKNQMHIQVKYDQCGNRFDAWQSKTW